VEAPPELAFAPGESPTPPPAAVKPNARAARAASVRPRRSGPSAALAWLKLGSGVVVAVAAALAVAWGVLRYTVSTPRFAVTKVELEGAERLSQAYVTRQMDLELGTNIFKFDPEAAEKRLLADPWIRQVKVTRRLPSTLRVELEERDAAAVAAIGERLYLVTRGGEPFKQMEAKDPFDLPVVTGVLPESLAKDRPREIERIAGALEVLRQWEKVPAAQVYPAQEIHLTEGGDAVLTVGKTGMTLHLGRAPFRRKLLMGDRVIQRLAKSGRVPGIVFLDNRAHPERVVVRMR
jgi:cell division protein FtsQ